MSAKNKRGSDVLAIDHTIVRDRHLPDMGLDRDRETMKVRRMRTSDIAHVGRVHLAAWQATYRGLLSDASLEGLSQPELERAWRQIVRRPERTNLVLEREGCVVGYIAFGPLTDPNDDAATGEIYGLYVHPDHWRSGAGGQLLAAALEQFDDRGVAQVVVWTMRDNAIGRRFYHKNGFCLDGYGREAERHGEKFLEVRLSRDVEERSLSALIVARSAQFRESLVVLMRAIPQIGSLEQADSISAALSEPTGEAPDLILCDFEAVQNEMVETLDRVKAQWSNSRCVVLVDDEGARQAAEAAGADVVLTKGVLAARLLETVERLL
jgi:ribosomal protein S18 acetylase RimI-like enzyme/CheY-like chemotaxis protein